MERFHIVLVCSTKYLMPKQNCVATKHEKREKKSTLPSIKHYNFFVENKTLKSSWPQAWLNWNTTIGLFIKI